MRIPRDLSGEDLVTALRRYGYRVTRQSGSPVRVTTDERGEHHVTIPRHNSLRVGTVSGVLADVAAHFGLPKQQVLDRLFGVDG